MNTNPNRITKIALSGIREGDFLKYVRYLSDMGFINLSGNGLKQDTVGRIPLKQDFAEGGNSQK